MVAPLKWSEILDEDLDAINLGRTIAYTLIDSVVEDNSVTISDPVYDARSLGGGISSSGNLTLISTTVRNNSATIWSPNTVAGTLVAGGGIFSGKSRRLEQIHVKLESSSIVGNRVVASGAGAVARGGGISFEFEVPSSPTMTTCSVFNNETTSVGVAAGGGLFLSAATTLVEDGTLYEGNAPNDFEQALP